MIIVSKLANPIKAELWGVHKEGLFLLADRSDGMFTFKDGRLDLGIA